jgi:AcrR family transcriptional regulator
MKTRDRILEASLTLFNESGTAAVSTNHIADALGMSPGNLYYHYRNKEEIIRALFEQQFQYTDKLYTLDSNQLPTLSDLQQLVRATFETAWRYRFIYRELIALLRRDQVLQQRWNEVRTRGFTGFHELVGLFVTAGVLRAPKDTATAQRLAELCWLVSEFWLASVEVGGASVTPSDMNHGVELLLQVLEPYLLTQ